MFPALLELVARSRRTSERSAQAWFRAYNRVLGNESLVANFKRSEGAKKSVENKPIRSTTDRMATPKARLRVYKLCECHS
jgi:hypothetical protein